MAKKNNLTPEKVLRGEGEQNMDFSVFDRKQKPLNETCEVIVVDFVNKRVQCRVNINNLAPSNPKVEAEIKAAVEAVRAIRRAYIENSPEDSKNTAKEQGA
jgi:hypothetical protein